jgi:hypothetical protein
MALFLEKKVQKLSDIILFLNELNQLTYLKKNYSSATLKRLTILIKFKYKL